MRLVLPLLLLLAPACSAMKRSWEFTAVAVDSPRAHLEVDEVRVRQKDLRVSLRLRLEEGGALRLADPRIQLDGGKDLSGHASLWEGSPLVYLKPEDDAIVNVGQTVELRLWFHTPTRDLRRAPVYALDLSGFTLDGVPLDLPPLQLRAPPEAPTGDGV